MSTEQLQRELARIAERAPTAVSLSTPGSGPGVRCGVPASPPWPARWPPSPWCAGLVSWLPQHDSHVPVTDGRSRSPGHRATASGWEELTPTSDLSVGRQAVALRSPNGDPVVVDAEDGTYHAAGPARVRGLHAAAPALARRPPAGLGLVRR